MRSRIVEMDTTTKATIRAIITIAGMELPMTLRLLRKPPASLRVIALDDFGGTIFHFVRTAKETTVLRRAPLIPAELLSSGLAEDLASWFFLADPESTVLVQLAPESANSTNTYGLLRETNGYATLYSSSKPDGPLDRVQTGVGGRLHTTIDCVWSGREPSSARIVNHRFGYTMDLDVRKWQIEDLTNARFEIHR